MAAGISHHPAVDAPVFDTVALIGLGLIGSSLGRAIKKWGLARKVVGSARTQPTIDTSLKLGFIDEGYIDPADAVREADLVVICTPMGAYKAIGEAIGPALKPGAIVSDTGSTKASVIADLSPSLPAGVALVPAHPVAGTEHSGPEAGFAELYIDRWCILTPPEGSDPAAVAKVEALWKGCGSNIEIMEAGHHDRVLAVTSHVPHLIAYTIVGTAQDLETASAQEVIKFSAGGFRDFTRIAASDPTMWRDVFLHNRGAVLEILQRFSEDLTALQRAIRWGDGEQLHAFFTRTRGIRRKVIDARQAQPETPKKATEGG
ncbi:prephenate/arogenate dehydrogenase family protein [Radicibacter daui]|uniref:prephenate/arogenate dehydrogenase family protein n=1 Tax=Radicibacter daui TaxID=3064829 RepID=UPI004046A9FE